MHARTLSPPPPPPPQTHACIRRYIYIHTYSRASTCTNTVTLYENRRKEGKKKTQKQKTDTEHNYTTTNEHLRVKSEGEKEGGGTAADPDWHAQTQSYRFTRPGQCRRIQNTMETAPSSFACRGGKNENQIAIHKHVVRDWRSFSSAVFQNSQEGPAECIRTAHRQGHGRQVPVWFWHHYLAQLNEWRNE